MTYEEFMGGNRSPYVIQTSASGAKMFEDAFVKEYIRTEVQPAIDSIPSNKGIISDGYHTFDELYEFRKLYNAALLNEWAAVYMKNCEMIKNGWRLLFNPLPKYDVHKSWRHNDGELCFGGGWFIVVAILPGGQISNHYKAEDWDLFKIPEVEKAKYAFDGHTSADVLQRLKEVL